MAKMLPSGTEFMRTLYTVLLSLAGAIVVLILIGTIFGLVRPGNAAPVFRLGRPEVRETGRVVSSDDIRVFTELGRLRIPLSDSSTLILSISFPYTHSDIYFTEELVAKIDEFREIARNYFSSLPPDGLIYINEDSAKAEILNLFNSSLRLGRIQSLYFNDFMVLTPG